MGSHLLFNAFLMAGLSEFKVSCISLHLCPKGRNTASSLGRDGFPSGISCTEWFPLKRNCSSLMNAADSLRVLKSNVTNDLSRSQLFKRNAFYTGQSLDAHTNPHWASPLPPAYLHKEDRALSACLESCQHIRGIRAVIRTEAAQTDRETATVPGSFPWEFARRGVITQVPQAKAHTLFSPATMGVLHHHSLQKWL